VKYSRRLKDKGSDLLNVVHALHGSIGLRVLVEADEAEATASTGVAVFNDNLSSYKYGMV
jgi:hypothetical protein